MEATSCVCKTRAGAPCAVKNATHEMVLVASGNTAYLEGKLPSRYDSAMWKVVTVKVCGGHKQVLAAGKAVNIIIEVPCGCVTRKEAVKVQIAARAGRVVPCHCGEGYRHELAVQMTSYSGKCVHCDWSTDQWTGVWTPIRKEGLALQIAHRGWMKSCRCGQGFVVGWRR